MKTNRTINSWFALLCLFLGCGLVACQSRPKIVNTSLRPLTQPELNTAVTERNADLIVQQQGNNATFVVLDTQDSIQYGTFNATTFERDDQTSKTYINHSLSGGSVNPSANVIVEQGRWEQSGDLVLVEPRSFQESFVVVVVREAALRQKLEMIRLTFKMQGSVDVPTTNSKGIFFRYTEPERDRCIKVELLSEMNQVLHTTKL